jgi:DNA-binding Lrp family transcriptional regulator
MLGISADEVKTRIEDYERDGVILGYTAIVNENKSNRGNMERVKAVIEVRITPEREGGFDKTAERIAKFDEVTSCFLMSGAYDILIFVEGKNLNQVASFVARKLATLDRVQSTATHFMLKAYKDHGVIMEQSAAEERIAVAP